MSDIISIHSRDMQILLVTSYIEFGSIPRICDVTDDVYGEDFFCVMEQVLAEHGGILE